MPHPRFTGFFWTGPAAHHDRSNRESPATASLHHSNDCSGTIFLPTQQPQPWYSPSPLSSGCSCSPPRSASSLHVHSTGGSRLHRHRCPFGGFPRFSSSCGTAHCVPSQHCPPSSCQHGSTCPPISHHPPKSVSGSVCPPDLYQCIASLCLHWISPEPHQGQPVPLHLNTGLRKKYECTLRGVRDEAAFILWSLAGERTMQWEAQTKLERKERLWGRRKREKKREGETSSTLLFKKNEKKMKKDKKNEKQNYKNTHKKTTFCTKLNSGRNRRTITVWSCFWITSPIDFYRLFSSDNRRLHLGICCSNLLIQSFIRVWVLFFIF